MRRKVLFAAGLSLPFLVALPASEARADQTLTFDGNVPTDGPDHFFIPFQLPAGIQEIEVLHDDQSDANILDFGMNDTAGYRGWGGGTPEDAIIGVNAASRAYVPGPLPVGTWNVIVGKAKIVVSPATYHVVITLRTTPTLAPQTDRKAYVPAQPLSNDRRYYACDFHVHDRESTDAIPTLEQNIQVAESVGLDAIEASDHNTITQLDYFSDLQAKHPHLLIIPGIEWTTYHGHGNAIGATTWVDHKIGQPGITVDSQVDLIRAQTLAGSAAHALFAINHPALDVGNLCIGCSWAYPVLAASKVDAMEIESGGYRQAGFVFTTPALKLWDQLLDTGAHVAAIGGSDDHRGGDDSGQFQSPIGNPTTYVVADNLSVAAIVEGVRNGRTVVKMQDPSDPMIDFSSSIAPVGDTVSARSTVLQATVTGGHRDGVTVQLVQNGVPLTEVPVTSDPFSLVMNTTAPLTGEDRWRVEVLVNEHERTVTSHLFVRYDAQGPDGVAEAQATVQGGGCALSSRRSPASPWLWVGVTAVIAAAGRRRRRQK